MISKHDSSETNNLLRDAARGDTAALGRLLDRDRDRLRRMVALRIDRRLNNRIDASDVIQEAQLEASERLAEYVQNPTMSFFLWLRLITGQRLAALHRRHLGAQMRTAGREVSLDRPLLPHATSAALAAQLLGRFTSPSATAVRAEMKLRLQEALDSMDPIDREVLTLRHFERLNTAETAQELGISDEAAKKRHIRALKRLKDILTHMPGGPGASNL
jgi:RNA polymerase sigma-70 factor (ECF subfamily)